MVTHSANAVFRALGDPTRRAVLDLLRSGRQREILRSRFRCPGRLFPNTFALRRANLVHEHRSGRHRFYELDPQPLKAVDQWLGQYRDFWSAKLRHLKVFVESAHAKERSTRKKAGEKEEKPI